MKASAHATAANIDMANAKHRAVIMRLNGERWILCPAYLLHLSLRHVLILWSQTNRHGALDDRRFRPIEETTSWKYRLVAALLLLSRGRRRRRHILVRVVVGADLGRV